MKKVKEVDLDLNFGHSFDVQHIFQFKDNDFSSVELQIANGAVNIVPWEDEDIRAECQAKVYRVDTQEASRETLFFSILNVKLKEISFLSVRKRKQ